MKRILVATDLSSRSELAVMRAAALAKARNAELTVLNVLDDDQPPVLIAPQRLAIANLLEVNGQALKERLGVESKAIVRVGDPVVVINAVAEEIGADLLVMGAHRHTPLRDLFIGTTLERVVRNAKIPVLRAAGAPEEEYRRVLLALDFSPTSTRAVQMAGQLGFLDAASLTALHAFEPFAKGMMRYSGIKEDRVEHYVDQEELKANVELRDYVAGLGLGREDIQLRVGEGLPINVIMTEVRRQAPQLTVLGTQGLTGFRRALIGSVAEAALGDLPCDVLAVEGAQAFAVGGGPFREDQQVASAVQLFGQALVDQPAVARAAADEQGAGLFRQPAGQRPGTHLGLGQEGQRRQGAEQRDIGPGHMVGYPQHGLPGRFAADPDLEGQGRAEARQPPAGQALAQRRDVGAGQPLAQADPSGQAQSERDQPEQAGAAQQQAQPRHQTAALKWRA